MQGIPIRSGKIIEELIDQLPWLLGDGIGLLLVKKREVRVTDLPKDDSGCHDGQSRA